jgi:coenzyme F420 hydrogenase subunit beta
VAKTDITKGKFIITKKDGSTDKRPVKLFNDFVTEACRLCTNFTSRLADISVGSVGTALGWSTVIVRSQKGMELVKAAEEMGYIETTENADPAEVKKTDSFKDEKRKETQEKREKEGSRIPRYD